MTPELRRINSEYEPIVTYNQTDAVIAANEDASTLATTRRLPRVHLARCREATMRRNDGLPPVNT